MADEPKTDRKACTLAVATIRYLERLSKKGTHGTSVPKVMTTLIEDGVRRAIESGYIKLEEDENPPNSV
jgi:hypothetical protein